MSDVTARYASDWCTATRRLRLSESWWQETLEPYAPSKEERELEEDDIMSEQNMLYWSCVYTNLSCIMTVYIGVGILHSHPLPTSINDYKSHPLYVLRRHLLKFEGSDVPASM